MTNEAPQSNYKPIFRETFNDEATVRRNGGEITAVTFAEGKGTFNGTSSKINYNLGLNGTYSVRVICNPTSFTTYRWLFDCRGSSYNGVGSVYLNTGDGVVNKTSGTSYVKGVASSTIVAGVSNEIVISGITLRQGTGSNKTLIGSEFSNSLEFLGTIDLFEIYEGTLTASEVANLYNDRWNTEVTGLDGQAGSNLVTNGTFDTASGWIRDETWTISGGTANFDAAGNTKPLTKTLILELNKKYLVNFDVISGTARLSFNTSGGAPLFSEGEFKANYTGHNSFIGTAIATNGFRIYGYNDGGGTACSIDNLIVQELQPDLLLDFNSTNGVLEDKTVGNTVGGDIIAPLNFTSGWESTVGVTINNATTFSTIQIGGIRRSTIISVGKK